MLDVPSCDRVCPPCAAPDPWLLRVFDVGFVVWAMAGTAIIAMEATIPESSDFISVSAFDSS